jgi:hypothetical protein
MAAIKRRPTEWRFYVYELTDEFGAVKYVGKGSGNRVDVSRRTRGLSGRKVASFKKEADAYKYEIQRIAEYEPELNKHPGGNGPRAKRRPPVRVPRWQTEIESIGARVYAARLLLKYDLRNLIDCSKIERIREIAHERL